MKGFLQLLQAPHGFFLVHMSLVLGNIVFSIIRIYFVKYSRFLILSRYLIIVQMYSVSTVNEYNDYSLVDVAKWCVYDI